MADSEIDSTLSLKRKYEDESNVAGIKDLLSFTLTRVLNTGLNGSVWLLGSFEDESKSAIVKINPQPITAFTVDGSLLETAVRGLTIQLKKESGSRFSYFDGNSSEFVKYGVEVHHMTVFIFRKCISNWYFPFRSSILRRKRIY